jgi:amino acid transporter
MTAPSHNRKDTAVSATRTGSDELTPQQQLEAYGYKQELKRSVSTIDLLIYGLIFMVPIAPWAIFGVVYNAAEGMVPLVYLIGLIAMIFTAVAYQQMSKSIPLAGSVFSYVGRGINPQPASSPAGQSCSTTSWCRHCSTSSPPNRWSGFFPTPHAGSGR